jgi:hypothetical protein
MAKSNQQQDDSILIDFLRGECSPDEAAAVKSRLLTDADFKRLHDDLQRTFRAMALCPSAEPPDDLVARTVARVRQARRMDVLVAREEVGRGVPLAVFSWRELLAVAASVMLVAALFVPAVQKVREASQQARCASNIGQIGAGLLSHANDNGGLLPRASDKPVRWLGQGDQRVVSNSEALYSLIREDRIAPAAFVCPAVGQAPALSDPRGLTDFPSAAYVTYSYQHTLGQALRRGDLVDVADRMAILADATPIFRNGRFQPGLLQMNSDNHGGRGQAVLYLDNHVEWKDRPTAGVQNNQIFLAEGIYQYCGEEKPVSATDTFLLPPFSRVCTAP